MADRTKIEWADATWSPMTGCTPISEGCEHCWAERMAKRFDLRNLAPGETISIGEHFKPRFHPDRLDQPLHWRKPRRIFVCSMSDLFHEAFTDEQIEQVLSLAYRAPQHTYLVLTKRPERACRIMCWITEQVARREADWTRVMPGMLVHDWPPRNLWLGTTVENQQRADERIPILLDTPAAVRFVSVEPMLGPVDLEACGALRTIDWIICGGETGPGARPMQPEWALDLWRQCKASGVPFFLKQWGTWADHRFPLSPGGPFAVVATTREYPEVTP